MPAAHMCGCSFQNGHLKVKVSGANVPQLSGSIYEFTPANAEIDSLEVRQQPAITPAASTPAAVIASAADYKPRSASGLLQQKCLGANVNPAVGAT